MVSAVNLHPLAASFVPAGPRLHRSMSWMAALPEDQREATVARIGAIIGPGETPEELPVHVIVGLTSLA